MLFIASSVVLLGLYLCVRAVRYERGCIGKKNRVCSRPDQFYGGSPCSLNFSYLCATLLVHDDIGACGGPGQLELSIALYYRFLH